MSAVGYETLFDNKQGRIMQRITCVLFSLSTLTIRYLQLERYLNFLLLYQ